jgi:4-amino-4-deoxy-L-arabinose transferase-like glycosyltransferase
VHTASIGAAVAAVLVFWGLGRNTLSAWDEAWYARIALEMVRGGDWLVYNIDGRPDPEVYKPPLGIWITALCFSALGPTEFAARVFPASCYVMLIAVVAGWSCARLCPAVGLLGATFLSTDQLLLCHHGARSGDLDAPLMLLLTLVMIGVWRLGEDASGRRLRHSWLAAVLAVAMLVKGWAALQVIPAACLWLAWKRNGRAAIFLIAMTLAAMLPFFGWLAMRESRQPGFARQVVGVDLLGRVAENVDEGGQGRLSYIRDVGMSAAPLIIGLSMLTLLTGFRPRLADLARPNESARSLLIFLLLWWLVPFVAFSLARTHRVWYIYPSLVPLAVLAAWVGHAAVTRLASRGWGVPARLTAFAVLATLIPHAVWTVVHGSRTDDRRREELNEMLALAEQAARSQPVLVTGIDPRVKFYLYRSSVRYEYAHDGAVPAAWEGGLLLNSRKAAEYLAQRESHDQQRHRRFEAIDCSFLDLRPIR